MIILKTMNHKLTFTSLLLLLVFGAAAQKNSNNIVLVMPFCSKQILDNPNHSNAMLGNLCREYYQGALLAVDSLKQGDNNLRLSVFDTENDSLILVGLIKKQAFKEAHLIIGPVLQGGNKVMTDFAKGKDVVHVSPLMTFSKTRLNDPNFVAANPNLPNYAKLILQFIQQQEGSANIIVVSDKSGLDKSISGVLKQQQSQQKDLKIKTVEYVKGIDLQSVLIAGKVNHIIIASSNENVVKNSLHSIKDTSLFQSVKVYGFPQWLEFKNSEYTLWQQAHVHIATPFYVDYQNEQVKQFVERYRSVYFTEPTEAAFKGFDQILFFANQLDNNGAKMMNKIDGESFPVMHTTFKFVKQEDKSGYQNMYLNMLEIQHYKWVKKN